MVMEEEASITLTFARSRIKASMVLEVKSSNMQGHL